MSQTEDETGPSIDEEGGSLLGNGTASTAKRNTHGGVVKIGMVCVKAQEAKRDGKKN